MANFKLFYPKLKQNEGGYANNPLDSGGQTYAGIARNFNPKWAGWKHIDRTISELKTAYAKGWPEGGLVPLLNKALKANAILQDMIFQFYKINYWNSLQLDFVNNQMLAEQMADMGVNAGTMRPAKMVQQLLNTAIHRMDRNDEEVKVDGDIGPASIRAINQAKIGDLYWQFVNMRKQFYYFRVGQLERVTDGNEMFFRDKLNLRPKPDQIVFLKSWLSRCVPATI